MLASCPMLAASNIGSPTDRFLPFCFVQVFNGSLDAVWLEITKASTMREQVNNVAFCSASACRTVQSSSITSPAVLQTLICRNVVSLQRCSAASKSSVHEYRCACFIRCFQYIHCYILQLTHNNLLLVMQVACASNTKSTVQGVRHSTFGVAQSEMPDIGYETRMCKRQGSDLSPEDKQPAKVVIHGGTAKAEVRESNKLELQTAPFSASHKHLANKPV